jgi:hypothetical protein
MESAAYQKMGLDLMDLCEDHEAKNVFVFKFDRSFYFETFKRDELDKAYLHELFDLVDEEIDIEILRSGKKVALDSVLDGPPEVAFFMVSFANEYFAVLVMRTDELSDAAQDELKQLVTEIEADLEGILQTDTRQQPPVFAL